MNKPKAKQNYLSLVPVRRTEEYEKENGKITLLVPKFKNLAFARWFIPQKKSTHFRIRLDEMGSLVWELIDGTRTVEEICRLMQAELLALNKSDAYIEERVTIFMSELLKHRFVKINGASRRSNE